MQVIESAEELPDTGKLIFVLCLIYLLSIVGNVTLISDTDKPMQFLGNWLISIGELIFIIFKIINSIFPK